MTPRPERHAGKVTRVLRDYGFISADDIPEPDVYFKPAWYRGSPPLCEGDRVTFLVIKYGEDLQAKELMREGDASQTGTGLQPHTDQLLNWAYLGYLPNVLGQLRAIALPERWDFKNQPPDPGRPFPILHSYLRHTFARLVLEDKVMVSSNEQFAAFNTGLVDPRYETIFAVFGRNKSGQCAWELSDFCIAGEAISGQNLVRHFNPLPRPAHYFDEPTDLLYDVRQGGPELDWNHIVIERVDRYPMEFLGDHCPNGFELVDPRTLGWEDRRQYAEALGAAIQNDSRTYRRIMNRVRDAVELAIKRVSWNFKTAVPQYYPRVKRLQLLLPLCLVSDDSVDLALAVETTPAGSYLGHTALPLDWAYTNARLICRPNSDWLEPNEIESPEQCEED